MRTCPQGKEFVFEDGKSANTIHSLVEHIKELSPEQFSRYVNGWKNDFYNWINDCISHEVAETIKGNVSQRDIIERLTGHHWHHEHRKKYKY